MGPGPGGVGPGGPGFFFFVNVTESTTINTIAIRIAPPMSPYLILFFLYSALAR